mgnify:FL=1
MDYVSEPRCRVGDVVTVEMDTPEPIQPLFLIVASVPASKFSWQVLSLSSTWFTPTGRTVPVPDANCTPIRGKQLERLFLLKDSVLRERVELVKSIWSAREKREGTSSVITAKDVTKTFDPSGHPVVKDILQDFASIGVESLILPQRDIQKLIDEKLAAGEKAHERVMINCNRYATNLDPNSFEDRVLGIGRTIKRHALGYDEASKPQTPLPAQELRDISAQVLQEVKIAVEMIYYDLPNEHQIDIQTVKRRWLAAGFAAHFDEAKANDHSNQSDLMWSPRGFSDMTKTDKSDTTGWPNINALERRLLSDAMAASPPTQKGRGDLPVFAPVDYLGFHHYNYVLSKPVNDTFITVDFSRNKEAISPLAHHFRELPKAPVVAVDDTVEEDTVDEELNCRVGDVASPNETHRGNSFWYLLSQPGDLVLVKHRERNVDGIMCWRAHEISSGNSILVSDAELQPVRGDKLERLFKFKKGLRDQVKDLRSKLPT